MSDLTGDLEGGSVLFLDYDQYACKTLLPKDPHPLLHKPAVMVKLYTQSNTLIVML